MGDKAEPILLTRQTSMSVADGEDAKKVKGTPFGPSAADML